MKILTIVAHPDDETMLTGGTLALLQKTGADMFYLCATRGEGGDIGEPPVSTRDRLGEIREDEFNKAVTALGGGQIGFLDYIDPLVGNEQKLFPYTDKIDDLVKKILQFIKKIHPDVVITHGVNGEYGHPGHILTHKAVSSAVSNIKVDGLLLYSFCADFPNHPSPRHANPDNPAHVILDVSSVMDQKINAAYSHRSQIALFLRRQSRNAGYTLTVPEVLMKVESLHRVLPIVHGTPDDILVHALQPWIITSELSFT